MFVCKCQNTCHRPASPVFPRAAMLWERNLKETNGYVYRLFRERMSWTEAVKACEAEGAQLVTIRSRKNQDFVGGIAKNNPTWIGARQIGRSLQWMDGSGVAGMQENRELRDPWWHDNVEFFGKDTCLNIYLKRWATKKCESDLPFVCEKKL
ncbi:hypothetical protein L596_016987 [Steinernema carpocapsae]|uniref:C-type lectin domain-containing protein n=1 Tax=Steinernema carpocapsae TaxID=34508 RepID=A0A4U5N003_STECR|nr:hypothetical protein L596_016987 [Steinernema carpocapsae]